MKETPTVLTVLTMLCRLNALPPLIEMPKTGLMLHLQNIPKVTFVKPMNDGSMKKKTTKRLPTQKHLLEQLNH